MIKKFESFLELFCCHISKHFYALFFYIFTLLVPWKIIFKAVASFFFQICTLYVPWKKPALHCPTFQKKAAGCRILRLFSLFIHYLCIYAFAFLGYRFFKAINPTTINTIPTGKLIQADFVNPATIYVTNDTAATNIAYGSCVDTCFT